MQKEHTEVIGRYSTKGAERKHARGKLRGRHFPLRGKDRQGLVKKQAIGQAAKTWGLYPSFLKIQLDKRNALQQLPRNGLSYARSWLWLLFAHDKPHLGRIIPPAGAPQALQEARNCEGSVDLKGPFKAPYVNAKLKRRRRNRGKRPILIFHGIFRRLTQSRRQVPVMNQETIIFALRLAI
jgi:hypothetical protein